MCTAVKLIAAIAVATLAVATPAHAAMPRPVGLKIIKAPCPDPDMGAPFVIACTYPDGRVYLGPAADRFSRSREIGHAFGFLAMSDGDRHWFARVLRLPGAGTWTDYKSEVFADVYATCDLALDREEDGSWPGGENFQPPSEARMGRVCAAIKRVGLRQPSGL